MGAMTVRFSRAHVRGAFSPLVENLGSTNGWQSRGYVMYKFVVTQGSCGSPYNVAACEKQANTMLSQGFELQHVYQSTTTGCTGQNSVLVMVFRKVR